MGVGFGKLGSAGGGCGVEGSGYEVTSEAERTGFL